MTGAVAVLVVVLLVVAGWLRAAGTAITRVPRADALRDSSDDVRGAANVAELLENREVIAPAIGLLSTGVLAPAAAIAAALMARGFEPIGQMLLVAGLTGLVFFLLGDLIPRRLGRMRPRRLAYASHRLLSGAVRLGGWANDLTPDSDEADEIVGDEIDDASDEQERVLIDSVLEFGETFVREVMTPRPDMTTIPVTGSIDELIEVSTTAGYSRVPVTSDGDVVGMVIVKDLLSMLTEDGQKPDSVAQVMRTVEFVPENKLASALLSEMQESHTHQMIVVDEFGDVVGLVTIEDLLEELVGEIADETDAEATLVVATDGGWEIDARLTIDEFCKVVGIVAPDLEGDTVGGLLLGIAERVPEEGETFELDGVSLTVVTMQGRRISEVRATRSARIEST